MKQILLFPCFEVFIKTPHLHWPTLWVVEWQDVGFQKAKFPLLRSHTVSVYYSPNRTHYPFCPFSFEGGGAPLCGQMSFPS